ncbi:SDR family NAD(P)-dependent oxidoreductase [Rhodococcus sp. Z13]|uniref:SDR family NAD(P)-dependent oxidoreductase n=1 Tax=Rhodococcus sacchari TaxID=2962047 RepID=A0ACD4DL70_9NOCA|nr:SDR family NAD(P)-dependent oxidoreductase [Rhodococcus sp. Z13]UYP20718.1 SDR family NAD(P)-dependent oxidoreductase [Rhodococcus sp. Z13]
MNDTRPLAVVTGASRGIGRELAALFAVDGHDLVLVARSPALDDAAAELESSGVSVTPVHADLRTEAGVRAVYEAATAGGRVPAAVALNAGTGIGGAFVDADPEELLAVVDVNVRSTVHLARLFLADMVRAGSGRLLFTSSVVSLMPGPYQAVYNASKAFVQSFTDGIHDELSDTDVTVTSMLPGATDTHFFARAGMLDTLLGKGPKDDPARVAKDGYDALLRGDRRVVAGSLLARSMAAFGALAPDAVTGAVHKVLARPRSGG